MRCYGIPIEYTQDLLDLGKVLKFKSKIHANIWSFIYMHGTL